MNSLRASSDAARQIALNLSTRGYSRRQHDASEALLALMQYCDVPQISFKALDFYQDTGAQRPTARDRSSGTSIYPSGGVDQEKSLQEAINANLVEELRGVRNEQGNERNVDRKKFLIEPPETLSILLLRFTFDDPYTNPIPKKSQAPITGIIENITRPTFQQDAEPVETTYSPYAVICHSGGNSVNSGHYTTFVKKDDQWFFINDDVAIPVNLEDAYSARLSYREFLEQNAYVVSCLRQP